MIPGPLLWLVHSRAGRIVAAIGAVLIGALAIRRAGYRAAEADRAARDMDAALDVRRRADSAARRADADDRPSDERLADHGALRDE